MSWRIKLYYSATVRPARRERATGTVLRLQTGTAETYNVPKDVKMLRENSGRHEVPRRPPKLPRGVCGQPRPRRALWQSVCVASCWGCGR